MSDWSTLQPLLLDAIGETLLMAVVTLMLGGLLGLGLGVLLVVTRRGGVVQVPWLNVLLNVVVNIMRPIPFVIFITAVGPLTREVMGSTVGTRAALFPLVLAAIFGVSRIVEQTLVAVDDGVIEAALAMGASPWRVVRDVLIPEAMGPLVLGYTFLFVAIVDMTAVAGAVAAGGLGDFAITYGYQRFDWGVTWVAVAIIVLIVQLAQFSGNALARRLLDR